MKLYYQDDNVTLYHGDCLEIDAWLAADVLVTDPPYVMEFQSGWDTSRTGTPRERVFTPIAGDCDESVRDEVLGRWDGRPAAVFGTWKISRPNGISNLLVWDKRGVGPGMGDLNAPFGSSHEEIYLLGRWNKPAAFPRRGSVIATESHPMRLTTNIGHPTPKPVGLMEILINAAPEGTIADPFAGSGSTLIAARNLGRTAIGVEIEERYCELIAKRLRGARVTRCPSTFFGAQCDGTTGHRGHHWSDTPVDTNSYAVVWTDKSADDSPK